MQEKVYTVTIYKTANLGYMANMYRNNINKVGRKYIVVGSQKISKEIFETGTYTYVDSYGQEFVSFLKREEAEEYILTKTKSLSYYFYAFGTSDNSDC